MVFQKPTPFPMSIYDNVAFGLRLYEKLPKSELDGRIEESLRKAALWDEVKDKLKQSGMGLSGGQQQRLCIARTVAQRPEVILLDEPTSALDPISTLRIEELIDELKRDFTLCIVTHNMQQAARCADQVAFFYLGELVEVAPAAQLFTAPRERRTQEYTVIIVTHNMQQAARVSDRTAFFTAIRTGAPASALARAAGWTAASSAIAAALRMGSVLRTRRLSGRAPDHRDHPGAVDHRAPRDQAADLALRPLSRTRR